ncbi:MAG: hypothetical protein ABSE82_09440 [Nitrososphaerales archaeon]|jgi:DNA-binding CsgD family transcriptional regulator
MPTKPTRSSNTKSSESRIAEALETLSRRFDAIIRLNLDEQLSRGIKRSDQLVLLDSVGLSTGEIASILGQSSKDVSSHLKKAKAKRDNKKQRSQTD